MPGIMQHYVKEDFTQLKTMPAYNHAVEGFRDAEYPMLKGKTYLDHGGTTLYAKSLITEFSTDMISNLYGNPHSDSTPSALAGHRVDAIRERTLRFFNADPEDFDLVFVSNATAAIKLVKEGFRDYAAGASRKGERTFWYGYHRDAHSSLVGVREETNGNHHCFHEDDEVEQWLSGSEDSVKTGPKKDGVGLFAYPGQSNMTGRRLPLDWPGKLRRSVYGEHTYSLLDAAALATTKQIDLSDEANAPDFTCISFYKIFGFPNIGGLIIRKRAGHMLLRRKYFGGGTVDMVVSIGDTWHAKKDYSLHDQLEDGTLPFHSIFALGAAMDVHQRLFGSMTQISSHTAYLARHLHDGLSSLVHFNGQPVAHVYKDANATYGDANTQGATIAFNIQRADGSLVGYADVEKLADSCNIYVRSGGLCNPGGIATYLEWKPWEMKAAYAAGHRCSRPTQTMQGKPTGVVRVSLGAMSTLSDVTMFLGFLTEAYVEKVRLGAPVSQLAQMSTAHLPQMSTAHLPQTSTMNLPQMSTLHLPQLSGTVYTVSDNAVVDKKYVQPSQDPNMMPRKVRWMKSVSNLVKSRRREAVY